MLEEENCVPFPGVALRERLPFSRPLPLSARNTNSEVGGGKANTPKHRTMTQFGGATNTVHGNKYLKTVLWDQDHRRGATSIPTDYAHLPAGACRRKTKAMAHTYFGQKTRRPPPPPTTNPKTPSTPNNLLLFLLSSPAPPPQRVSRHCRNRRKPVGAPPPPNRIVGVVEETRSYYGSLRDETLALHFSAVGLKARVSATHRF